MFFSIPIRNEDQKEYKRYVYVTNNKHERIGLFIPKDYQTRRKTIPSIWDNSYYQEEVRLMLHSGAWTNMTQTKVVHLDASWYPLAKFDCK